MTSAAMTRPEVLLLIETAGHRRKVAVSKSPFTIGRAEDCDAAIADFRVSRVHARLFIEDGRYSIMDAGSRHGTFVNGARVDRATLKNHDEITLGVSGLKLTFLEGGTVSNATQVFLNRFSSESATSDMEKLKLFLEAARSLSSGVVVEDVLRNMLDYALRLTKAERGFVYLKQAGNGASLACGLDSSGHSLSQDANVSRSVVQEAMASAAEFITGDAMQQSSLALRESIVANELRTVIAIPLRVRSAAVATPPPQPGQNRPSPGTPAPPPQPGQNRPSPGTPAPEVDGVIYLDSRSVSHNLSGVSHDVLRALAGECASVLEHARMLEAEQAAKQYRQEMEIAASIQRSLIAEPEVECDFARVSGRSIPCREVGGDFFDVFISPSGVTVIVADVSGKGVSAAVLASMVHGMFYAQVAAGAGLVETITAINRFLCSRVAGQKYATLLAAQLSNRGILEIVNCGHVPPIVVEARTATRISDGDLPVGLMADASFHSIQRQFPSGARLCLLTDGISESENADGVEFGLDRVEDCLRAKDALRETLVAVELFSGHREAQDDRTLVVVERTK